MQKANSLTNVVLTSAISLCRCMVGMLVMCGFVCSCSSDSEYDTSHQCYLVIDNSMHLDPTLMSATNQLAPGIFCRISIGVSAGAQCFCFETNQGLSSTVTMNDVDKRRTHTAGIYNESGVIVGYGNLDNPAIFYAYDAQCPNCYELSHMPQARLTMSSDGMAHCQKCQRKYNLNNGGIVITEGGGRKLYRYHTTPTTPTPQGVLSISN